MNHCSHCGKKVIHGASYCVECGRTVLDEPGPGRETQYAKIGGLLCIIGGLFGLFSMRYFFLGGQLSPLTLFYALLVGSPYLASVLAGALALNRRNWPLCLVLAIVGGVGFMFDMNILSLLGAVFIWVARREFTDVNWYPKYPTPPWHTATDDGAVPVKEKRKPKSKVRRAETKVMYRCCVCDEFLTPSRTMGGSSSTPPARPAGRSCGRGTF